MSSVVVITPVVIASWPAISAAVTAAIGAMGFSVAQGTASQRAQITTGNKAEIEVEDSEILKNSAGSGESIVVERDGITATFSRDARGALKVCMEGGAKHSKSELKRIGQELIDSVTQQYVYHRVVTELKERNMNIVDEQVAADRTVTIRVRNL